MYEGRVAAGRVTHTVSRGRLAWAEGVLHCEPGTARYVPMPPFSPWLFAGGAARDAAAAVDSRRVAREGDAPRTIATPPRDEL